MIIGTVPDSTLRVPQRGAIMTSMRLYTAEEYGELNLDDAKTELVRGVIVYEVRDQPRLPHAYTAGEIGYAIRHYLEMHPIGLLLPELDCETEHGPDTVRRPDVSFITHARAKRVRDREIPEDRKS